jgi:hypothetical protein
MDKDTFTSTITMRTVKNGVTLFAEYTLKYDNLDYADMHKLQATLGGALMALGDKKSS